MADITPVPSLSPDGWVTNTVMKADYLLSHFFMSEKSRSPLFPDGVSSFPWLIQKYQGDPSITARETEDTLRRYFGKYFPTVDAEVLAEAETEGSNRYQLKIYVRVVDADNKEFILSKLADVVDSKIANILSLNNYGIPATT